LAKRGAIERLFAIKKALAWLELLPGARVGQRHPLLHALLYGYAIDGSGCSSHPPAGADAFAETTPGLVERKELLRLEEGKKSPEAHPITDGASKCPSNDSQSRLPLPHRCPRACL